ncbi:MAG: hypothetical protein ACLTDR_05765 [Adlercreutzia equolifaciens]
MARPVIGAGGHPARGRQRENPPLAGMGSGKIIGGRRGHRARLSPTSWG